MILGSACTRNCGFCAVTSEPPTAPDSDEPERVADAAERMQLTYVVVTSVTRDDLPDGGAGHFAATIRSIRHRIPKALVEVLIPDFKGSEDALFDVVAASPHVLNHNVETVPRLYAAVRPHADYRRSILLLAEVRRLSPETITKSGFMVGLGKEPGEVRSLLEDLRRADCDLVTIGQYLRPSKAHHHVVEYIHPERFREYRQEAERLGFLGVASGPYVRSSYQAAELHKQALERMDPKHRK